MLIALKDKLEQAFLLILINVLLLWMTLSLRKQNSKKNLKTLFPPIETETWFTPKVNNTKRGYVKGVPFRKVHSEEFNPGSRQQITDRLRSKYEWVPEDVTDKGNAILNDEVLSSTSIP